MVALRMIVGPSVNRFVQVLVYAIAVFVPTISAHAGPCDVAWDGDKVVAGIAGKPSYLRVPLRDRKQQVTEVTVDQIQAFNEAKDRISRVAGLSPRFIICDGSDPNAFATADSNGDIVGVTVGMLKLVNGDRDIAGAVMGHEIAHRTRGHGESAVVRGALIGLAGLIIGTALDARQQRRTGVNTGVGVSLARIGSTLVSRKFDRDQEREADEVGLQYATAAAFSPNGAVRLAERMNKLGSGGIGLFFDSHPGWSERTERFRAMIASNPQAQQLVAQGAPPPDVATRSNQPTAVAVERSALAPNTQLEQQPRLLQASRSEATQPTALPQSMPGNRSYPDMMTAITSLDTNAVDYFLSKGVDINRSEDGSTYLIAAVRTGHVDMVKFLISKGADVNRADSRGLTPIVHAKVARPPDVAMIQFLQGAGAINPFARLADVQASKGTGSSKGLSQGQGAASTQPTAAANAETLEENLRELKRLFDAGLIEQDVYLERQHLLLGGKRLRR